MGVLRDRSQFYYERAKQLYFEKANAIAGDKGRIKNLLQKANQRIQTFKTHPRVKQAVEPIMIFKRMIYAHKSGAHKLSMKTLGLLVLGILYFVTPLDIIPDFLPLIGYADDVSVVIAIFNTLKTEIEEFLEWESSQKRGI
ncbi:Uncharacterized membrane protein YkvA, DUF1232 family [Belliella buryatensis]|uniref:Uncharacterized membrane protein YkvA, DUF1232 family n=1 Tax=Belliella buryatensis TaxID=1500549 RepID=A0A239CBM9_9BACT|nr:DUF1232 domain-containing protein [Belliella buryatensis]SNS17292.1 Uncharacterized membrane protein YkvA, DUF1232 family [Belliella buryatensis]